MNTTTSCNNSSATYLNNTSNIPSLVYYSHIPIILLCIIISIFTIKKNRDITKNFGLLLLVISLVIWISCSLIFWVSTYSNLIMTIWAVTILVEPLIYIGGLFLVKSFFKEVPTSFKENIILSLIYIPIIILLPTKYTLIGFDYVNCISIEGPMSLYYIYLIEILVILWMLFYYVYKIYFNKVRLSLDIKLNIFALFFPLLIFYVGNLIGSITSDWEIAAFGLLGMPIFLILNLYNIAEFRIFNTKISGSNLLVVTLWILIASLVLITDLFMSQIVITITFIISVFIGLILIKSSNRDRDQLETISSLASSLESLNNSLSDKVAEQTAEIKKSYEYELKARRDLEKLSETKDKFVSIAQHNLRIPTTNIKNKIDMVIEKTTDPKLKELLLQTKTSTNHLIDIADDFKSIAKLKIGSQILNLSNTSVYPILNTVLLELKLDAENMNLTITFPTDKESWPDLHIDANKIREVLLVIIENAIRYNFKNGNIQIATKIDGARFEMIIKNTGIGISENESNNLQNRQFYRSDKSKELNPTGMGIGLSLSKGIVEAHHGDLTIVSKGVDLGAITTLTLPINFPKSD
jgi:signal transduction histidine kinase